MQRFTFSPADPVGAYLDAYPAHYQAPALLGHLPPTATIPPALHPRLARICHRPPTPIDGTDWTQSDIGEVIDHLVATHHPYLFAELGRLEILITGLDDAALTSRMRRWGDELREHMIDEELTLFPLCLAMAHDQEVDPAQGLHGMYRGHEDAEADLVAICEAIGECRDDRDDDGLLGIIRLTLADVIADLHRHLELEDTVLLPAVLFECDLRATSLFRKSQVLKALQPKQISGG